MDLPKIIYDHTGKPNGVIDVRQQQPHKWLGKDMIKELHGLADQYFHAVGLSAQSVVVTPEMYAGLRRSLARSSPNFRLMGGSADQVIKSFLGVDVIVMTSEAPLSAPPPQPVQDLTTRELLAMIEEAGEAQMKMQQEPVPTEPVMRSVKWRRTRRG